MPRPRPQPAAPAKKGKKQPLDVQVDIRNDVPYFRDYFNDLEVPDLEKHMKSVMADNDGYLDESSLDFSVSNGKPRSENDYQIGELGDFAGFNSNDVNKRINYDSDSVSWTSGYADDIYSSEISGFEIN
jgi:hypothetical protein